MPKQNIVLNRTRAVQLTDGQKSAHIQELNNQKFYWVESATEPTLVEIKSGAYTSELSVPEGWVIWAISGSDSGEVVINTPSGA